MTRLNSKKMRQQSDLHYKLSVTHKTLVEFENYPKGFESIVLPVINIINFLVERCLILINTDQINILS